MVIIASAVLGILGLVVLLISMSAIVRRVFIIPLVLILSMDLNVTAQTQATKGSYASTTSTTAHK